MPVRESGALGILNNAQLSAFDKIAADTTTAEPGQKANLNDVLRRVADLEKKTDVLPRNITRRKAKDLEKGLLNGRLADSSAKLRDDKITAIREDKFSVVDEIVRALGINVKDRSKLKDISLVAGIGPVAGIRKVSEFTKIQKNVTQLKKSQKAIAKIVFEGNTLIGGASGLLTNVKRGGGGVSQLFNLLGTVGKFALPASFVIGIAAKVYEEYQKQYGNGGTRDVRKLVKASDTSLIGIENENFINSGEILFLSNPNKLQGLGNGPSNTENLREGEARYKQRHQGSYV